MLFEGNRQGGAPFDFQRGGAPLLKLLLILGGTSP